MPRRSGGGGGRMSSPSRGMSRQSPNVPARAPPAAPVAAAPPPSAVGQPRQPGMFAQIASTAAGVAIGSTVGHVIGGTIMGGGGHGGGDQQSNELAPQQAQQPVSYGQPMSQQQPAQGGVCQFELKQFLDCAQSQHDISLCSGFNEALRECRVGNGMPLQ